MRKRREASIVLSSSEEEVSNPPRPRRKQACSIPNPTFRSSARTVTRRNKKPCLPASRSADFDRGEFPGDSFEDLFYKCKGSSGNGLLPLESERSMDCGNLWIKKYQPTCLEELAVHKKKIEEVLSWFENRLSPSEPQSRNNVLLISGRAGVGKSTSIQLIASHFGARVCEWHAPVPMIWQEYMHNATTGIPYMSKLDEFISFVDNVRKFGLLSSSILDTSKAPFIILLDDLPGVNGRQTFEKLKYSLSDLTRSTCIPTVILITDCGNSDIVDHNVRYMVELQSSLIISGACKIALNPITSKSIKKVLTKIGRLEHCDVNTEEIDLLANSCGGDIRHAISSLQLFCLKQAAVSTPSHCTPCSSDANSDYVDSLTGKFSLLFSRDESLSLFHALGKFLHNKRDSEFSITADRINSFVREKLRRLPLKMDNPERIISLAHGKAGQVADFLHENVLDFMSDDATDGAWDVSSYLSDADVILSSSHRISLCYSEAENILQSVAASVAMRGVLFGNSHPSSSRWHAIRKPKLWEVEKSRLINNKQLLSVGGDSSIFNNANLSTDFAFALKWLRDRLFSSSEDAGNVSLANEESNALDEDDIEDC